MKQFVAIGSEMYSWTIHNCDTYYVWNW